MAVVLFFAQSLAAAQTFQSKVSASPPEDRKVFVLKSEKNFWNTSFVAESVTFSPARNQMLGPWQLKYTWDGSSLNLGGRLYTESDPRFSQIRKRCFREKSLASDLNSFLLFCRGDVKSNKNVFLLNDQSVAHDGLVALDSADPLRIHVAWSSGKSLTVSLQSPDEVSADIKILSDGAAEFTFVETPANPMDETNPPKEFYFSDPTLPRKSPTRVLKFSQEPAFILERGLDSTERRRLLVHFKKIPLERPQLLASPRRLGTYKGRVVFRTVSPDNTVTQWSTDELPLGLSHVEFRQGDRAYQTQIWNLKNSEISGQLSGFLLDAGRILATGEVSLVHFFENPFSPEFENWHTHRWGARLRYYSSMASFEGFQPTDPLNVSFTSIEARGLIGQGLWNLDSVQGGLLSFNRFDFFESSQNYLGLGYFWGRSMPRGIDYWFEKMSWFRYPKYVNLDISALVPTQEDRGASLSYVANFHGKMFIGRDWFIAGGVEFLQIRASTRRELAAVVGTIGGGLLF